MDNLSKTEEQTPKYFVLGMVDAPGHNKQVPHLYYNWLYKSRSKYMPHQGKQECIRRWYKMNKEQLHGG